MDSKPSCAWMMEADMHGTWFTGCNESFTFIDGSPTDNIFRYCPYCGGDLEESPTEKQA